MNRLGATLRQGPCRILGLSSLELVSGITLGELGGAGSLGLGHFVSLWGLGSADGTAWLQQLVQHKVDELS